MKSDYTLRRLSFSPDAHTHGVLMHLDTPLCVTLEPPWLDNAEGISCSLPGKYKVTRHRWDTPKHTKSGWHLHDVRGRSGILIHRGNYVSNTEGCILVGKAFMPGMITDSTATMNRLREILPETFELEIINP